MSELKSIEGLAMHLLDKKRVRGLERFTALERKVFKVVCADFDILSGGVAGYLGNAPSDHHLEVEQTLREIRAEASATFFSEVTKAFPAPGPDQDRDQDRRYDKFTSLSEAVQNRLEDLILTYDDGDVGRKLWAYWLNNGGATIVEDYPEPKPC